MSRTTIFQSLSWVLLAVLLACLIEVSPSAAGSEPINLEGTWYVLIHYQDPKTANPDAMRWKDLVWVFEAEGSRLKWTQYPTVVFEDPVGRWEFRHQDQRGRVLAAWEPNPKQRASLSRGPRVRPDKRVKTLRGSDANGWQSPRRPLEVGPSVMTYQENLTIEDLAGLPLFLRQDVVGNRSASDRSEGTRYQVESIDDDGKRLSGDYRRDGRQYGTFQMWRTPAPRGLPQRTEEERRVFPPGFSQEDFTQP